MKKGQEIARSAPPRKRREAKKVTRRSRRRDERAQLDAVRVDAESEPNIDPRHTGGWTD